MTRARSSLIDPGSTPYYHCMAHVPAGLTWMVKISR